MGRDDVIAYWMSPDHEVFVAEEGDTVVGTYFLRANQHGGGSHVVQLRLHHGSKRYWARRRPRHVHTLAGPRSSSGDSSQCSLTL